MGNSRVAKTWYIPGGSSGIGRALAGRSLRAAAVTVRDTGRTDRVRAAGVGRSLDLTRPETFAPALAAAERALGPTDTLVDDAGYGLGRGGSGNR